MKLMRLCCVTQFRSPCTAQLPQHFEALMTRNYHSSGRVKLQHELTGLRINLVVVAPSSSLTHRCVTSWQSAAVMDTMKASCLLYSGQQVPTIPACACGPRKN